MSTSRPRIFLSAGEPSGDLHGAAVARAILQRWPEAELYGLGGDLMRAAGVRLLAHAEQLAVMGFVEVLRHLPFFAGLWRQVKHEIASQPPDLIIPIDYPGFNLRLAALAKRRRIPVLYFIAPQVWAWHRSRMTQLAENVDRLAVVLPFEEKLFRDAGANAQFVGHPLLDLPDTTLERAAFLRSIGVAADAPLLALFPGSRAQELRRHLSLFMQAVQQLKAQGATVQPVWAAAPGIPEALYRETGWPHTSDTGSLLAHARAALVKSGTTTLQTALAEVPMVVTYQMHPLSYKLARRLVDVPHVALANLVAGKRVVPELIQEAATPEALAGALLPLLRDSDARDQAVDGLKQVRNQLASPEAGVSAAQQVTRLAAELIEARRA
jgi:lipid-A-disaccharide synthase